MKIFMVFVCLISTAACLPKYGVNETLAGEEVTREEITENVAVVKLQKFLDKNYPIIQFLAVIILFLTFALWFSEFGSRGYQDEQPPPNRIRDRSTATANDVISSIYQNYN